MRRGRILAILMAICGVGTTAVWDSPAYAAGSVAVTPNTNLMRSQAVQVDVSGFPDSTSIGVCQGVMDDTPSQSDCANGFGQVSNTGTFSLELVVTRNIQVPSLGRTVDCAIEACYVGAAELADIPNSVVYAPIAFSPELADGRIKRRSDGAITGDDVYGLGQNRQHTITPGGSWTYALQVQNDAPTTADVTVSASSLMSEGLSGEAQFFFGYYDVTSYMLGSGIVFRDMAPGEVQTFALRFHVPADAADGATANALLTFVAGSAGLTDLLGLSVLVQTPP